MMICPTPCERAKSSRLSTGSRPFKRTTSAPSSPRRLDVLVMQVALRLGVDALRRFVRSLDVDDEPVARQAAEPCGLPRRSNVDLRRGGG